MGVVLFPVRRAWEVDGQVSKDRAVRVGSLQRMVYGVTAQVMRRAMVWEKAVLTCIPLVVLYYRALNERRQDGLTFARHKRLVSRVKHHAMLHPGTSGLWTVGIYRSQTWYL